MRKTLLLLAASCKTGGLCPGGVDLHQVNQWIRLVADDGRDGELQGHDIDFARPLDLIEFDGHPVPSGKQTENWVIDNHSCRRLGRALFQGRQDDRALLDYIYSHYSYTGFWGNTREYLTAEEFNAVTEPSESILKATQVRIYKNSRGKTKLDFICELSPRPITNVSCTDQDYYYLRSGEEMYARQAYLVVSIPRALDWVNEATGDRLAYKFVSRVFVLA